MDPSDLSIDATDISSWVANHSIDNGGSDLDMAKMDANVNKAMMDRERGLADAIVVFHVLVAEDWYFSYERGDRVYAIFGPPVSDWNAEYPSVELWPCTTSAYANDRHLNYLMGKMNLARCHTDRQLLYKYVVQKVLDDGQTTRLIWEKIYADDWSSDYNRSLRVPKSIEEFHRFDDVVCRPPNRGRSFNRVHDYRTKASLCMSSAILAEIGKIGAETALRRIAALLKSHDIGIPISKMGDANVARRLRAYGYSPATVATETFDDCTMQFETATDDRLRFAVFLCVYMEEIGQTEFASIQQAVDLLTVFKEVCSRAGTIHQLTSSMAFKKTIGLSLVSLVDKYFAQLARGRLPDSPWMWFYVLPVLDELDCLSLWTKNHLWGWHQTVDHRSLEQTIEPELEDILTTVQQRPILTVHFLDALTPSTLVWILSNRQCREYLVMLPFVPLVEKYVATVTDVSRHEALLELGKVASDATDYEDQIRTLAVKLLSDDKNLRASLISLVLDLLHLCRYPTSETLQVYGKVFRILTHLLRHESISDVLPYVNKHLMQAQRMDQLLYQQVLDCVTKYVNGQPTADCLEAYLDHADRITEDLGNALLNRGYPALELLAVEEKDTGGFLGIFKRARNLFVNDKRRANAVRIVQRFFEKSPLPSSDPVDTVVALTETDLHRNMCHILHFVGTKSLTQSGRDKCRGIYRHINAVFKTVADESISVQDLRAVATKQRWERLRVVHETLREYDVTTDAKFPSFASLQSDLARVARFVKDREAIVLFLDTLKDDMDGRITDEALRDLTPSSLKDVALHDVDDDDAPHFGAEQLKKVRWILDGKRKSRIVADRFEAVLKESKIETAADVRHVIDAIVMLRVDVAKIAADIARATVTIRVVEDLFRDHHSPEDIVAEVAALNELFGCAISDDVTRRLQQVFKMGRHRELAVIVRDVCRVLGMKKELDVIVTILAAEDERANFVERPLSALTDDLLDSGGVFDRWSESEVTALAELRVCGKLLAWVKENIYTHQQLKVLVDLASISAGESDVDVDRILVFQAALNGYAPLVFELEDRGQMSHFVDCCEAFFRNLAADVKLPLYLRDSTRILAWIEEVHSRHGSVEASSLATVQLVNKTGAYLLSTDPVTLRYQADDKSLSHAELDELRSKLMLITAGDDGQKEVDHYIGILSAVEIVAKNLERLLVAGCSLFHRCKVTCYGYPRKVSVIVTFGNDGDVVRLTDPAECELRRLATFLADTYAEWVAYVSQMREEYPSLNYYTTDQLVRLASALAATLHRGRPLSAEATMLLGVAYHDVTVDLLREAFSHVDTTPRGAGVLRLRRDADLSTAKIAALKGSAEYGELIADFGYDENLALACVYWHGKRPETIGVDGLAEWCETHRDDSDYVEDLLFELGNMGTTEEALATDDRSQLETIWRDFLDNARGLEADLRTLAAGLQELARRCGRRPDRVFPAYLRPGWPNLVECAEADEHEVVLAIYQTDDAKALPGLDEVLICSTQTTAEQVELYCRRAFTDDTGKIFLVVHVHLLDLNVSIHVEKLFATVKHGKDYKLAFVSAKEHHDRSYLASAFSQQAVTIPPLPPPEVLRGYLAKHLAHSVADANCGRFRLPTSVADADCSRFLLLLSASLGDGKTLVAQRFGGDHLRTVNVHDDHVYFRSVTSKLKTHVNVSTTSGTVVHLDISANVVKGLDDLLFSIAILRGIADEMGQVWLCSEDDLYLAEVANPAPSCGLSDLLPTVFCEAPNAVLALLKERPQSFGHLVDDGGRRRLHLLDPKTYESPIFQRPYQYLSLLSRGNPKLEEFTYHDPAPQDRAADCLETLLRYCPVDGPSWRELYNFSTFLNRQLEMTELSAFCDSTLMQDILPNFQCFVVHFLLQMSQDFASRSVEISDESQGYRSPKISRRRQWENTPHPYVFFNEDGQTVSFFGLHFDASLNLVAENTGEILQKSMLSKALYDGLLLQGVVFNKSFQSLTRAEILADLCRVIGVPAHDPDPTYELTYDNFMKLLAVYTRFRCNIPVVIMGETGSGKTRLIRFLCDLLRRDVGGKNMLVQKTHGGITEEDVKHKVDAAVKLATANHAKGVPMTVLFFDEANTTNAIATIKTVICDRTNDGRPLPDDVGLQFAAAINPYRRHSDEMIRKLEQAGLGYHVAADETNDCIGEIPLRRLVYRVKELPASLFPFVWDFGTLDAATEKIYIAQMIAQGGAGWPSGAEEVLLTTLSESQQFMREQKDECSFVSLRDVERALTVLRWIDAKREHVHAVLQLDKAIDAFSVSLALALGVAYYVRLDDRRPYVKRVAPHFTGPYALGPSDNFCRVVEACQDLYVNELRLQSNIAKNDALKENVWMMATCIELRIPMFLVGKPGSSKSLSKTVVTDVMQGQQSYSPLFRNFKEIHMVSFQCSPLATADGILGVFRQCQKFQQDRDLSKFASVVVLDEIGLAEDSPKMPLKTLHPLLEDGCVADEEPLPYRKVAFVGISNWALDPAKMNRGILVSRGVPTKEDLVKSARSICSSDRDVKELMMPSIRLLTDGYCHVYDKQEREYFGLRDFYTVVKMALAIAQGQRKEPSARELQRCVQRNFGGYFGDFDPALEFLKHVRLVETADELIPSKELVLEAICDESPEARYILLLTKNNAALRILQDQNLLHQRRPLFLYGSSFTQDQEYTQVCRTIHRIKMAMELGQTVVLCNLAHLYESLYDALNQNYVMLGGRRYVDLGLGTHRVKCRVHEVFRLIVVAEDREVHEEFPVPLINRLEKHFLGMETVVSPWQLELVQKVKDWVRRFAEMRVSSFDGKSRYSYVAGDAFIGYHDDVVASLVMRHSATTDREEDVLEAVKRALLYCATPDSVFRLDQSNLPMDEQDWCFRTYHAEQQHRCLSDFLQSLGKEDRLVQVTTSARLLTNARKESIAAEMGLDTNAITLLSLQQFDTEQQFTDRAKRFLTDAGNRRHLFVQADMTPSSASANLIECAKFAMQDLMRERHDGGDFRIVFLLHVPRVSGGCFCGMAVTPWSGAHIDELCKDDVLVQFDAARIADCSVASLIETGGVQLGRLLIEIIPKACAIPGPDQTRVHRRIDILMGAVKSQSEFNTRLMEVLSQVIAGALKLQQLQGFEPPKLLVELAIGNDFLKEGHTFQRSIWLHLCKELTKVVTDIIAICDADGGLDFLAVGSANTDLADVYVELLSHCPLSDLPRVAEHNSNRVALFPFSRYIVNVHRQWHKEKLDVSDDASSVQLQALVNASPLAEPLRRAFQKGLPHLELYLRDFLHLNFSMLKLDDARELLYLQMLHLSTTERDQRLAIERGNAIDHVMPADVHLAYVCNGPSLDFLCNVVVFAPDVVSQLWNDVGTDLHLVTFQRALKRLEPQTEVLHVEATRRRYCTDVMKATSLFHQMALLDAPKMNKAILVDLEEMVRRLNIIRLYVQHMERCDCDLYPKVFARVKRLNIILKNNSLKSKGEFKKLLDFMKDLNSDISKESSIRGKDPCAICREDVVNPVELPCGHVGCKMCLTQYLTGEPKTCPQDGCTVEVPAGFELRRLEASEETIDRHHKFKQCLTEFFMDVLQQYVFGGERLIDVGVIEMLISFVVNSEGDKTKQPSPFKDFMDATSTTRSFVLRLLLQGDQSETSLEFLTKHLEQQRSLVKNPQHYLQLLLIVFCLEDYYFQKAERVRWGRQEVVALEVAVEFLRDSKWDQKWDQLANILSNVARVRLATHTTAVVLQKHLTLADDNCDAREFLDQAQAAVTAYRDGSPVKKLLVRMMITLFRKDVVGDWKRSSQYLGLMPEELLNVNWVSEADPFLVLDGCYKNVRDAASKAMAMDRYDDLAVVLRQNGDVQLQLACGLYYARHIGRFALTNAAHLVEALRTDFLSLAGVAQDVLLTDVDVLRQTFACVSGRQSSIIALLHHLSVVNKYEIWQDHPLTAPWRRIIANPASVRLYPTMPQDDTVEVRQATQGVTRWFQCPNGHQYGIGECGNPYAQGTCPTCHALIGAQSYNRFVGTGLSAQQTPEAVAVDRTMPGHILGAAKEHDKSFRQRGLNGLQVALARFVLHASMALGCTKDTSWADNVFQPKVAAADVPEFLMAHLELNLEQIAAQLGRNEDDAQVLLHRVLCRMSMQLPTDVVVDAALETKVQREAWENAVAKHIFDPEIAALEQSLTELAKAAEMERNAADSALMNILNEKADADGPFNVATQPSFWLPKERITLETVVFKLGEEKLANFCPNFSRMLTKEPSLKEMANFPKILELMELMTTKFDGRIERSVMLSTKISDFVYDRKYFDNDTERKRVVRLTQAFLDCFNKLRNKLPEVGQSGERALQALNGNPLSMDAPSDVLFPSMYDPGQCSVALAQFLINENNWMLRRYCEEQHWDPQELRDYEILPDEVAFEHLVAFDENRLQLLLLYHSEYYLDDGTQIQWHLSEQALEQSIIEKCLVGRLLIQEKLGRFHYQNEKQRGGPLGSVIPQQPLTEASWRQLRVDLQRLADTCSLLSLVEMTRDLLLVTGGNGDQLLLEEMDMLRLDTSSWKRILKPFCLKHVDNLVEVLRLRRARQLLENKQDPFDRVSKQYKEKLESEEERGVISALTSHFKLNLLLITIHEFILVRLCNDDPIDANGEFGGYLYGHLEEAGKSDLAVELSSVISNSVKNKHVIDVFNQLLLPN